MTENDRVFDAFRNCITEPKCKNCPWTECDKLKNRRVEIPIDLALEVMRMLKVEEPVEPIYGADNYIRCGKCKHHIVGIIAQDTGNRLPIQKYCAECGQAVKWE